MELKQAGQKNILPQNNAIGVEITFYTDPLCCWSWGLEPQWRRLRYEYGANVKWRYCMSGLLPAWPSFADAVHAVSRPAQMGPVWMEASHLTGMPVHSAIWVLNPPSSSYPACIAVKAAGLQSAQAEEMYLRKLRETLMIEHQNIAQLNILTEVAQKVAKAAPGAFNFFLFEEDLQNNRALEAFRTDLHEVQTRGIHRFPTLIFRKENRPFLGLTGYRPYSALEEIMKTLDVPKPDKRMKAEADKIFWGLVTPREEEEFKQADRI